MATARRSTTYAVLMGDIVGSEKAASIKTIHRSFNKAIDAANRAHAASIASPLTITLGDEFQGLLSGLTRAWEVASELRIRLLVAGVSCRFVIGVAMLETPLNKTQAWNMMGPGFSAAREKLNDKQQANAYRFSLPEEPIVEPLMDAVGDSLTQVELEWTRTQLEYYSRIRDSKRTNAEVARRLGVTTRSLYKVLRAGRAEFHRRQCEVLGNALRRLDERYELQ